MTSSGGRMILIKHILQSLPTYILSAMNPPKGIIKLMEKHFANFFWGTNEGKNKYHWSSWNNLCLSQDEGGADVRKMEDIIDILSIKRWWRFRTHPSLWTNFFKNKYCKRAHPVNKKPNPTDSHIWRNMLKIRDKAEENIIWEIQKGNCSFWWDNWTGDANEDDFPVWTTSNDGRFSSNSA
ncbi:putative mitochondrial protein AtMg00310 [Nicotiana tabacum]|uniref:Mitochondrial protein AtMg00310 n=1 Tax=Nicotiana tabacum TaxID=4097 RepID=A0AC58UHZ8_TOBAC